MKKLFIFLALLISLQGFGQTVLRSGQTVLTVYDAEQPLHIETTCEVWLDGKDDGSFTLDGTSVDQWDDKGALGADVSNDVDATRPTYDINTGRVTFTAANQTFLQSAVFGSALSQPNTVFVVVKNSVFIDYAYIIDLNSAAQVCLLNTESLGVNWQMYAGAILLGATNINDNIHTLGFNGVSSEYWINGASVSVSVGNPGAGAIDRITLGARAALTLNADMELMEVIVFNADISDVDRDKITGYLANKWDITATSDFKGYVLYEMMWLILLLIPNIRRKEEEFKIAA